MPTTIHDVARRAKVSPATVSPVLNNAAGVRAETRERVLAAVNQLNFSPSTAAKGLRSGRTGMVGVVVPDLSSLFFIEVVKGLENTLTLSEYRVIVCDSQNQLRKERENCTWLLDANVDGLILISPMMDGKALLQLADMGVPLGVFGPGVEHPNVASVSVENRAAAARAVQHLYNHGHRKIGAITGPSGHVDSEERFQGYQDALATLGLPQNPDWVQCGFLNEEGGERALEAILAAPDRPTALFVINDEMALGALLAARRIGLEVPHDLAIIGFDNVRLARLVTPSLASVNQPKLDIGFRLAQNMLQRLNGSADPEHVVISSDLVVRQSCGCG